MTMSVNWDVIDKKLLVKQKQIKKVEAELGIEFNVRDKITSWLRKANVMYYKGQYIDMKTQEPLTFVYE